MAAVAGLTAAGIGGTVWTLAWTTSGPGSTYYVWAGGLLIGTTTSLTYVVSAAPGDTLVVDVFDSSGDIPEPEYTGKLFLQWEAVAGAVQYRIDRYVDSAWTPLDYVAERGQWLPYKTTIALDDCTTEQLRIVAIDRYGFEGATQAWSAFIVRTPARPAQSGTYAPLTSTITMTVT